MKVEPKQVKNKQDQVAKQILTSRGDTKGKSNNRIEVDKAVEGRALKTEREPHAAVAETTEGSVF